LIEFSYLNLDQWVLFGKGPGQEARHRNQ